MLAKLRIVLSILVSFGIGIKPVHAVDPLVDVGNTKYLGSALPNGITQWLGVRYAAPPLGDLRFRAPVDPPGNDTTQIADMVCIPFFAACPHYGRRWY